MKRNRTRKMMVALAVVLCLLVATACGGKNDTGGATAPNASGKQELTKVKVALSAFQDVNSIHVGIQKGFYEEEGIQLEIQNTDWPGANELLIGGHVQMATSTESDVTLQNANGQDTTLAFPLFYFAGGGLMYDAKKHGDWKVFDKFMEENGNDIKQAMAATLSQLKGKKVGVSAAAGEYATFIEMVSFSGLKTEDFQIIDLAQEELPPALLSGSIDIMISGIPQRLAVLKQGYETLIDQTALASTVVHAGFAASRAWVDENPELASKIQKVILKTLDYIEKNPDEAFPIISAKLKEAGTVVETEELKGVWNNMEFFPSSKEWYNKEVVSPDGRFYWKDRFQTVVDNLKTEGKLKADYNPDLEQLNYGLKTVAGIQ